MGTLEGADCSTEAVLVDNGIMIRWQSELESDDDGDGDGDGDGSAGGDGDGDRDVNGDEVDVGTLRDCVRKELSFCVRLLVRREVETDGIRRDRFAVLLVTETAIRDNSNQPRQHGWYN